MRGSRMRLAGSGTDQLRSILARLFNWIGRFSAAKKIFCRLPHVDIAIFDTHTADHLTQVLADYSFFTIDIRGESVHLPTLVGSFIEYLRLRGRKKLSLLYYSQYINGLGARICITNQDANAMFFDLARENGSIRFVALQQGLKQEFTIGAFSNICGDYYAYGAAYSEKLNNGEARIIVAGSLKANNAEFERGKHEHVAYISSFVGHALNTRVLETYNYAELSYPAIYGALRIVDSFCAKNGIELIVVSKSFREQTEIERDHVMQSEKRLYKNVLGRDANIVAGNSYVTAGESRLIICDQSALGYELLGRGCKVIFLSLISHFLHQPSYHFGWPLTLPDQGPFWSSVPDPVYIEEMLKTVWHMSQDEWDETTLPYKDQLMVYDKGNSILHGQLRALLNASGRRANASH